MRFTRTLYALGDIRVDERFALLPISIFKLHFWECRWLTRVKVKEILCMSLRGRKYWRALEFIDE